MKKLLCLSLCLFLMPAAGALSEKSAELTVYFPNWNVYSDALAEVKYLPWDDVDCINHAFWKIVPEDGGYTIVSTDPWADTDESNPASHFKQYAEYSSLHPDTKILLSIGGWTDSGFFSEMALTEEGRASFIESCARTMEKYPFLSGIDIDWEYPGVARSGGDGDEGNPVLGDDKTNYTLLLKEMREAFDARFGEGAKIITVCAGASSGTLSRQDYAALWPYVDRINLMTYDLAGSWNSFTGHQSPLYGAASADAAVEYLLSKGVPEGRIAIGSPFYSHAWQLYRPSANPVGAAAKPILGGDTEWKELHKLEQLAVPDGEKGWHAVYDEKACAAYLWNDDPDSESYLHFHTYDSEESVKAKIKYIKDRGLGGLIVWQIHGDSAVDGWPMIRGMK